MIEFRVLGSLGLRGADGQEVLSVLAQPKRMAILAYLAAASPRGFIRRDTLAGLFWPEGDQAHARATLRKSIHHLRKSLGEDSVLNRGDEEIGLDWGRVECDAIRFQEAIEEEAWGSALETYRGDFLEGFFLSGCPEFEQWADGERVRLRELAAGAAWTLAHQHLNAGRVVDGERMGQRALSHVCTDESEARRFIQALMEAGDRAAAVRFYERFAQVLHETLDLEPSSETTALVEAIRGSNGPGGGLEKGKPPTTSPRSPPSRIQDLESLVREGLAPDLSVLRKIGSGSSGAEVYLARETALDRLVAVKLLSPELSRDPVARVRFEREAKAAASLGHPNAVPVYRFGWLADEVPFLVMQYVNGPTLEERLAAEGPLSVPDARRVLAQLAAALAEAHRKGFVHRDVSPGNVLCDREADRVLLTDFGLAGLLPQKEGSLPRVTTKGEILGSPGYSSPEQLQGLDPTEGTDVYALGVLGYEILIGEGPFPARDLEEQAAGHLRLTPRPLAGFRDDVDAELADLLLRCLAKEPGKRPAAAFLARALSKDPGPQSGSGEVRGKRLELPQAAGGGVMPAGVPRLTAERKRTWLMVVVAVVAIVAAGLGGWFVTRDGSSQGSPMEPGGLPATGVVGEEFPGRVIVMTFENETGDSSLGPMGRRLAGWIEDQLRRAAVAPVIPLHSYTGAEAAALRIGDPRTAAVELNAELVVTGEYYRTGAELEFLAHILKPSGEKAIADLPAAGGSVENPMGAFQNLGEAVVAAVAAYFEKEWVSVSPGLYSAPPSLEAYDLFVQARELFSMSRWDEALDLHAGVNELAPDWMFNKASETWCYINSGDYATADSVVALLEANRNHLTRWEQEWLDWTRAWLTGDLDLEYRAAREFNRIDPLTANYAGAATGLRSNHLKEGLAYLASWDSTSPFVRNWLANWMSANTVHTDLLAGLGRYEDALKVARIGKASFPASLLPRTQEAELLAALGRRGDVEGLLTEARENPEPIRGVGCQPSYGCCGEGRSWNWTDRRRHSLCRPGSG